MYPPSFRRPDVWVYGQRYRTQIGQEAEEIVAQGKLLPDDVMLKIVASKLDHLRNKVRIPPHKLTA